MKDIAFYPAHATQYRRPFTARVCHYLTGSYVEVRDANGDCMADAYVDRQLEDARRCAQTLLDLVQLRFGVYV
jgi:hypothetical protein